MTLVGVVGAGRGHSPDGEHLVSLLPGTLCNPEFFNYGVEAYEACKTRSLTSDIIDEQKKVLEADLVIFQVYFSSIYYSELD